MVNSIGTLIRQLRREQNKTQAELGGAVFSKSYVSAVESDKLVPSKEALRHFALSLGKPEHYFLALTSLPPGKTLLPPADVSALGASGTPLQERVTLLTTLFNQADYPELPAEDLLFSFSPEIVRQLPQSDQAHYFFFRGLTLQQKQEYRAAIEYLEYALARENHLEHRAAILHELGKCHLQMRVLPIAFDYALRAHQIAEQQPDFTTLTSLPFQIELQGGHVCLDMGLYQHALKYLEKARLALTSRQPMHLAGQLYQSLGDSTYGLAYQQAFTADRNFERIEYLYQQALTYLLQSLTIAQISGDGAGENSQRLRLAMLRLDWSAWRQRSLRQTKRENPPALNKGLAYLSSWLDEASEHCRQTLNRSQERDTRGALPAQTSSMLLALSLLIRVVVQRALLAHEQGYESTFQREKAFASFLCQQTLEACENAEQLLTLAWSVSNLIENPLLQTSAALPRLPETWTRSADGHGSVNIDLAEIAFAAGEVAEMLGITATSADFARDCYVRADACFLQAFSLLSADEARVQLDAGSLIRAHQRYILLAEERLFREQEQTQEDNQTANAILVFCKQQLRAIPQYFLPS